jgi:hypothetical protein
LNEVINIKLMQTMYIIYLMNEYYLNLIKKIELILTESK